MPTKKTASHPHREGTAGKTAPEPKSRAAGSAPKAAASKETTASKAASAPDTAKKHVGDVLGISRARVSKSVPSGGRRPKGIELARPSTTGLKPFRVVGGVRGRGQ